jgi:hypothetical protein
MTPTRTRPTTEEEVALIQRIYWLVFRYLYGKDRAPKEAHAAAREVEMTAREVLGLDPLEYEKLKGALR